MNEKQLRVQDDAQIHVAQFLQEGVGATRQAAITLDTLPLDDGLVAHDLIATLKLTRIPTGILAAGEVTAQVMLQCIRCLEDAPTMVVAEFSDEFRPSVDILTGAVLDLDDAEDDEEFFTITSLHLLDLREALRQALVLNLPMAPLCREDCPGLPEANQTTGDVDERLAILGNLLGRTSEQ